MMADPEFFSSILGSLPGVDPNDAQIQEVLAQLAQGQRPATSGAPANPAKPDDKSGNAGKEEKQ